MDVILKNPTFILFAILFLGIALGNIKIKGVSLGSSGVLFIALLAGHLGYDIPYGIAGFGTALFVYCVGLGVGNRFFAALCSKGSSLVLLSLIVIGLAWALSMVLCSIFGIDGEMAVGIFAGALTSTPALAAATEAVTNEAALNIGYGVAYPFGVIGVVLFVQLLPRLLKQDLSQATEKEHEGTDPHKIISCVVTVHNPDIMGKCIEKFEEENNMLCRITRTVKNEQMHLLTPNDTFSADMDVLLLGERANVLREASIFGSIDPAKQHPRGFGDESSEVIILAQKLCNKTLSDLHTLSNYGIIISRITRLGATFVPTGSTEIIRNDVARIVGSPQAIKAFAQLCGHRSNALNATDLLSLTGGVTAGIILGNVSFALGNGPGFSLGMAGGPLIIALILGHFGKIGPIVGYMPRPTRLLLMELALMLFLAEAGVKGGEKLVETLQQQGMVMFLIGIAVTIIPLVIGYLFARKVLRMSLPESLGGICGSMTSTPALGAMTAKTDAQGPVIAYATAYPAALILMTLLAKALLWFM